jgi:hypothetical protein
MALQLEIVNDLREQWSGTARQRRTAEAGMEFFSDAFTTDELPSFEHQRLHASFRQVASSDERVVA